MAKQLAFHVDTSACTGCKACQIACKDKWNLKVGVDWRRVAEYAGGTWVRQEDNTYQPDIFAYYVSISCNHCDQPICLEVCPAQAISKRQDGIVLIDDSKCLGCRYCQWSCPYGGPQFDEERGKMTKCTFCNDYLDQGRPPACVAACPSRALHFGELDELRKQFGNIDAIEPLPQADLTGPSLVLTPNQYAQPSGSGTGKLANPEEVWLNEPSLITDID
jgi:anaerobic dimethyl sulfoxide reductase subunit B (iron-sulfur subunit)